MSRFIKSNLLLIIIVLLASILRIYSLSNIPISLNPDETAVGYNSYSILKTGMDEYGEPPIVLKSFGDWKLPGYPIIATLPIAAFDLNEFSVRLPSALAGIIQIILIYVIALILFKKKSVALLASVIFAFNPWAIYFSRIAYEVNVATTFFMAGFIILLKYFDNQKKFDRYLLVSAVFFSLTIVTYHAYIIFTPLFLFFLGIIMRKQFKKSAFLFASMFIVAIISIFYLYIVSQTMSKFADVSLFTDTGVIEKRITIFRTDNSSENSQLTRIIHNRYTGIPYQIAQNYIASFSPTFLFDKGGEKFLHNIGTMGNLYLFDAIFLLFGIIALARTKDKRIIPILIWLVLAPIPSSLTRDAPSSTRLFIMLPVLVLIMSCGAQFIIDFLKKNSIFGKVALVGIILIYLVNIFYFMDAYFVHMNYQRASYLHYGFKEAVELSNKYPDKKVVMFGPENFPYISFLFYNKYDPKKFREEVVYYPDNYANFVNVKEFGRYHFVDNIDYDNLSADAIYIDYRGIRDVDMKIEYPNGEPAFKYFFKGSK
jgi:4-amino-4-deoxy-L-arabinose transferase-like glycosyltransferase